MTADDEVTRFATEMATNAELIETLLRAHPSEGICLGCGVRSSRPPIVAPCSTRSLALLAAEIRTTELLIERLAHGGAPDPDDPITEPLAVWVSEVNR